MNADISRWGKYRIRRLIAKGGMAEVFEAEITGPAGFSKTVCLKRVRPELMGNDEFVEMFETEAKIAAMLHHTNIVTVFDFDRHDGQMFLAMEYVEGCNLKQIVTEIDKMSLKSPVDFAVHVMDGLLAALSHAHTRRVKGSERPVIHRDVSPHNVLISTDGTVKLADFGIAKSRGISDATQMGVIKGKLAYLAPEQLDGRVSYASDLFSAGLVFYEVLTGRRLFPSDDGNSLAARIKSFQYEPIPWLSQKLNDFLAGLLALEPGDRFESAEAARAALREIGVSPMSEEKAAQIVQSALQREKRRIEESAAKKVAVPPASLTAMTRLSQTESSGSGPGDTPRKSRVFPAPRRRIAPIFAAAALLSAVTVGALVIVDRGRPTPDPTTTPDTAASSAENGESSAATFSENNSGNRASKAENPSPESPDAPRASDAKIVRLDAPEASASKDASPPKLPSEPVSRKAASRRAKSKAASSSAVAEAGAAQKGSLEVNVRPWAEVWVDGVSKGTTPIKDLFLKPGRHKVRIENKPLGFKEALKVHIRAGKPTVINRKIKKQLLPL